jgi:cation-transporting ATPase 13A3/4/5
MICDLTSEKKVSVTNFYESEDVKKPVADNYEPGTNGMIELKPRKEKTETDFVCEIDELPYKAVEIGKKGDYVFCITGSLFQQIYNTENNNEIIEIKREFMNYIKVFARSKPNDKTKAISIFQTIGRTTAMCGDGANDCGALKQADAGLSLAEAEASISAPFTSKVQNISSMVSLIRECRGGLATNFSLFNIMALYSLIQYTSTVLTQYFYAYPADFQYLYWDVACNFFFFLTIGYTASEDKLSKLIPSDSLFSLGNILSVLVMFALQLVCQILSLVIMSNPPFSDMIRYW